MFEHYLLTIHETEDEAPVSDLAAGRLLAAARWGEDLSSPCCRRPMRQRRTRPRVFVCPGCRSERSITGGTFFEMSKLSPLAMWTCFRAQVQEVPMSASALARRAGIHLETAWQWTVKVRSLVSCSGSVPVDGVVESAENLVIPVRAPDPRSPKPVPGADLALVEALRHPSASVGLGLVADTVCTCRAVALDRPQRGVARWIEDQVASPGFVLCRPMDEGRATAWSEIILHQILSVHRTVSRRWLLRYAQFTAARLINAATQVRGIVFLSLFRERAPFDAIRPGGSPYEDFDQHCRLRIGQVRLAHWVSPSSPAH